MDLEFHYSGRITFVGILYTMKKLAHVSSVVSIWLGGDGSERGIV
jgi:hypothetical protein